MQTQLPPTKRQKTNETPSAFTEKCVSKESVEQLNEKNHSLENHKIEENRMKSNNLEGIVNSDAQKNESMAIDTNLYSRQLGAYGFEMMNKLVQLNVLIVNVKGTGLECAKNLILSGPKSVCIYDNEPCSISDMGVNFYITEEDVKNRTRRSDAVKKHLQELNNYVHVYNETDEINQEKIEQFDVVVVCDQNRETIIKFNKMVRNVSKKRIGFICCNIYGLSGYVFVDLGKEFVCHDRTGENVKTCNISKITKEEKGKVSYYFDKGTPFDVGDYVKFDKVEGMKEINNRIFQVEQVNKYVITIGDTSSFSDYIKGGECSQLKVPARLNFDTYEQVSKIPLKQNSEKKKVRQKDMVYEEINGVDSFMICDFSKIDNSAHLHYAIQALQKYEEQNKRLPDNDEEQELQKVYEYAKEMHLKDKEQKLLSASMDEVNKDVVFLTAKYAKASIAPIASFFGGLLAQEIVKFTGKFMPIYQIMYLDFFECVSGKKNMAKDTKRENSKNDHMISIFGKAFQKKLRELNVFLIGGGALGCEYAKLFSLMGMCEGNNKTGEEGGVLTITDNDHVEISNLNRQFLFRREHVGKSKSKTIGARIQSSNKGMNVDTLETKVGADSEHIFNDTFWNKQNIIVNALDNIQARQYVDQKCVWFLKPLFESGTLGTKGNVQVIIPFLTQSYNDSYDPAEDSIPLCTLKHFPYEIVHTIEYARDIFQGLFYNTPLNIQQFLNNKEEYIEKIKEEGNNATQLELLKNVINTLNDLSEVCTFDFCIKKAVHLFEESFINQINQLLYSFPPDYKLSSGEFFWVGQKKTPSPLQFDMKDELVQEFLLSTSNLLAQAYNIKGTQDIAYIVEVASKVKLTPFKPKVMKVKFDEKDLNNISITEISDMGVIDEYCEQLMKIDTSKLNVQPIEFEKDDDTNYHIEFIHSFANLRAKNYKIDTCDKLHAKVVSGKIIPALATTTSIITGLVSIELIKYVNYQEEIQEFVKLTTEERKKEKDVLSFFKNAFINSSLPMFLFSEPMPPVRTVNKDYDELMKGPIKAIPNGFSTWDRVELRMQNGTIKQLIEHLTELHQVEVNLISVGNVCLYNSFIPSHQKDRLNKPLHEVYMKIISQNLPDDKDYLVVDASCNDEEQVDVFMPSIKFIFK